jgi:murein L,D-transpeptidase YafK
MILNKNIQINKKRIANKLAIISMAIVIIIITTNANAQLAQPVLLQPNTSNPFLSYQKGFKRVVEVFTKREDTLQKEFAKKGLKWPAKYMYIRSFKYDSQMEVWLKNDKAEQYKLFKTYKVCALAGTLGPKRVEGDYQVPEGFYYINEFKPNSNYHLALGLNYPNASDRVLSDSLQPGAQIYVHGSCTTVGCIPITNDQIEEVYTIAAAVHSQGQDFIPIHVFPISFKNKKTKEYLTKFLETRTDYAPLVEKLKYAYYYFELKKNMPIIMIDKKGDYLFDNEIKLVYEEPEPIKIVIPKKMATKVDFDEATIAKVFYRQAVAPNGIKGFQLFLDELSKELATLMPEGSAKRIFITVEFVIDKTGKVILPKVLSNVAPEMHNKIIERFEAMPKWTPAIDVKEKPLAVKLQQGIEINK